VQTSSPPSAADWYFDTCASAHMSSSPGTVSHPHTSARICFHHRWKRRTAACHAYSSCRHSYSFYSSLNNILVSPPLIKNQILLRNLLVITMSRLNLTPLVFQSRIFLPERSGSVVKAQVTSIHCGCHSTPPSLPRYRRLWSCGISDLCYKRWQKRQEVKEIKPQGDTRFNVENRPNTRVKNHRRQPESNFIMIGVRLQTPIVAAYKK
jgi:hypothetical protein